MRECGLKCPNFEILEKKVKVTPRAGVWIEMVLIQNPPLCVTVTPRAGVWIEIADRNFQGNRRQVTPRAGVWIEMHLIERKQSRHESLPVRECGLK